MEGLTAGRMVHYVMKGKANVRPAGDQDDGTRLAHRPAVVTYVYNDDSVDLCVFTRGHHDGFGGMSGCFVATSVSHDEEGNTVDTWHWSERA